MQSISRTIRSFRLIEDIGEGFVDSLRSNFETVKYADKIAEATRNTNKIGNHLKGDLDNLVIRKPDGKIDPIATNKLIDDVVGVAGRKVRIDADSAGKTLSKIHGNINQLSDSEVEGVVGIARRGDSVDVDDYVQFKKTYGNGTVASYLAKQELDRIRGDYELLDLDHTILGDFNPDGTFKGGGHYYEVMDSYIKEGKVEAFLDKGGTQPIVSLDEAPTNSAGITRVYVREYKPWSSNQVPDPTTKTLSPKDMTQRSYANIGNGLVAEGNQVPGRDTYEGIIELNNELVIVEGYITPDNLRTWYLTYE